VPGPYGVIAAAMDLSLVYNIDILLRTLSVLCGICFSMMETDKAFKELAGSSGWDNLPKESFVDVISTFSVTTLVAWRDELFGDAHTVLGFPTDRLLKKRRGGKVHNKLAEDCYFLYAFSLGSVAINEFSEIFSATVQCSVTSVSQANSPAPLTPMQATPNMQSLASPHTPSWRRFLPSTPTPNKQGAGSTTLIDTLAAVQGMVHTNREDIDQLKDLTGNVQQPEMPADFAEILQKLQSTIEELRAILDRRSKKVIDLESNVMLVMAENRSLQNKVADQSKELGCINKVLHKCESECMSLKVARNEDKSLVSKATDETLKKFKELKAWVRDIEVDTRDIKSQISRIKEPTSAGNTALKSDHKQLKSTVSNIESDVYRLDQQLLKISQQCSKFRKEQAKSSKVINNLKQSVRTEDTAYNLSTVGGSHDCIVDDTDQLSGNDKQYVNEDIDSNQQADGADVSNEYSTEQLYSTYSNRDGQTSGNGQKGLYPKTYTANDQRRPWKDNPKYEHYYLGNIFNESLDRKMLQDYLEKKGVIARYVKVMPNKLRNCRGAKIAVERGHNKDLFHDFFPGEVYCRKWYAE
jgi:hypothetical protein